MENSTMLDIHNIIMKTVVIVPKSLDMHGENFNCDCHLELTERTYKLIGEKFNTTAEEGKKIVDKYLGLETN